MLLPQVTLSPIVLKIMIDWPGLDSFKYLYKQNYN